MLERVVYSTAVMRERQQISTVKVMRRASPRQRKIAALIGLVVVVLFLGLWLLERLGFDWGLIFPPCGLKMRTGWPCVTCGMTTAVRAFARGEISTAFYIQPAAAFLCSLLVLAAFFAFLIAAFGVYFSVLDRLFAELRMWHVVVGLLVILAAGWAVTLARVWAART
jgi:hypothetical protein